MSGQTHTHTQTHIQTPITVIPLQNLPKHARYRTMYRRFGFFWGLGVEHETYVQSSQTRTVRAFDTAAMRAERYSVAYYSAYKPESLSAALSDVLVAAGSAGLTVPVILNSHSFTDCDLFGEHATTYERVPKPNPRYAGKTLFDWAREYSVWLRDEYGRVFMWDGDTVEFVTQRFYCARVDDVMAELQEGEDRFVRELNALPRQGVLVAYGPLRLTAPVNPGWATHLTNPRGVSMFNNGTIHINITLPTRLGWNRRPLWPRHFREEHRRLARLVQWLEPLWIAAHGSPDPFSECATVGGQFAAGSQRLAVSRYIGVGTFDTETMPVGKILQVPRLAGQFPWYDWQVASSGYAPLDVIGLDLNYNKHWAHGLEIRFLDQLPMADLRTIMLQMVVLMDIAREGWVVSNPVRSAEWQRAVRESLYSGGGWRVRPEMLNAICVALRVAPGFKEPLGPGDALRQLFALLEPRRGFCWRMMA